MIAHNSAGWGHKPTLPQQKTEAKAKHTFKRELTFTLSILLPHSALRRNRMDRDFILVGHEVFIDCTDVLIYKTERGS